MQAVILAAGESSRFWPLNQQHKSQIKILGRSLVFWTIKSIAEKGIKDIVLVTGPNNLTSLKEELTPLMQDLGVKLSFAVQEKPLGTGNAIFQAKDLIKGSFFVFWPYKTIAGNIIDEILKRYSAKNLEIILVSTKTENPRDFGILELEDNKVLGILENPVPGKEPSKLKATGAYFLQPDFFDYYQKISQHREEDLVDILNLYIGEKRVSNIVWEKDLPSLKYPWEVLEIMKTMFGSRDFKNYLSPSSVIDSSVVITGFVHVGENVKIGPHTTIFGPCFIGDNCQIGASNILRGPVSLEKGVKTGAFCEIKNSLIEEETHFHSGYCGDSVIGSNCRFGAGFVTANRRIDRKNIVSSMKEQKIDTGLTFFGTIVGPNSKFGINCGTMPGVLVGSNCLVGPGTMVFENIEDNTTFYTEFKGIKRINNDKS